MGRRTRQRTLLLQTDWGLTERFAVRAVVPLIDIAASGMFTFHGSGLGDVEAWGHWGLGPELGAHGGALGAGLALPTGRDVGSELTEINSVAFSAGELSLLLSAEGFRRLAPSHTLFGLVLYRRPLGSGPGDYRFGDSLGWSGIWRWSPERTPVSFSLGLTGQHLGQDEQAGERLPFRGGRLHYATGGVSLPLGKNGGSLSLLAQRLVERDVRGDQLLAPWNLMVGYSFSWGEHTHDGPGHDDHHGEHGGAP